MKQGHILFLGTGASAGVPVIGCHCAVCTSELAQNKRLRTSALLTVNNRTILIDCGPDFRTQALTHKVDNIDGLILTHSHNDHTAGIDDLKIYCIRGKKSLPTLVSAETECEIVRRYYYLFNPKDLYKGFSAHLELHTLPLPQGSTEFLDIPIKYFSYEQLGMAVNGFRFGDLAYITDIRDYDEGIH
jgi:phosphoribosyl 1,2-cyclic phosphate phosphodiesterase